MRQHLTEKHPGWQFATDIIMTSLIDQIEISSKEEDALSIPETHQGQYRPTAEQREEHRLEVPGRAEEHGDSPRKSRQQHPASNPTIHPLSLCTTNPLSSHTPALLTDSKDPFTS
jgi:hypothetical protein